MTKAVGLRRPDKAAANPRTALVVAALTAVSASALGQPVPDAIPTTPAVTTPPPLGGTPSAPFAYGAPTQAVGLRAPDASVGRGWTITPSIEGRVTATDNANRAPSAQKESDLIFDIIPGLAIRGGTPRLRLNASYLGQRSIFTRNSDRSTWNNSLGASFTAEAIEQFFYIDASAAITQQFVSAFGARPESVADDFGNRFESRAASVSPYFRGFIGPSISYYLRYSRAWTEAGGTALDLGSSTTDQVIGQLQGPLAPRLRWSLDYLYVDTEWSNLTRTQESARYWGTLFFQISPDFTIFALGGRERNNYRSDRSDTEWFNTYGGGFAVRPTPRTEIQAQAERRFFGTGYNFSLSHRQFGAAFSVVGSRDVVTPLTRAFVIPAGDVRALLDASLIAQIPDPVARRAAVDQLIAASGLPPVTSNQTSFYTQRILLQKSIEPVIAIIGLRNTISFSAFWRDVRPIDDIVTVGVAESLFNVDSIQTGGSISWTHRLSVNSALTARLSRLNTEARAPSTAESTQDELNVTWTRRLGMRTSAFTGFRILRFDSNLGTDFVEKAVFGGLAHTF